MTARTDRIRLPDIRQEIAGIRDLTEDADQLEPLDRAIVALIERS